MPVRCRPRADTDRVSDRPRGPVMIAATDIMRPPPTRIGKIGGNITLPRTVPLKAAVAALVGALVGLFFAFPIAGIGLNALIWGGIVGGAAGVVAVTWSPLRGESLLRWLGLNVRAAAASKVRIDGKPVRLYIGVAPLARSAVGPARLVPGAVNVPAGEVDDRGVPIPPRRRVPALDPAAAALDAQLSPELPPDRPDGPPAASGAHPPAAPGRAAPTTPRRRRNARRGDDSPPRSRLEQFRAATAQPTLPSRPDDR